MRRRYKTMLLRFTPEELAALDRKVSRTNLTREGYCRCVLRGSEVREAPNADFPFLIREIRGMRNDLDEALSRFDHPALITAAENCRRAEKLLWDTFTSEGG